MKIKQLLLPVIALCMTAVSGHAAVIIPNTKIASGTITTGATMILINSPTVGELPLSSTAVVGPNWVDNSADGWRLPDAGSVDGGTQGTSPWQPDGSTSQGQLRFFGNGVITSYTFNLADSGINLPDGAVINAIYGTWTTRGTSGAVYTYTEGASGSFTRSHVSGPTVNLALNWTNNLNAVQTANFERLFNTPITVVGGNGFTLNVARSGNTHQTDAILLDVTLPVPEPSAALLGGVGMMLLLRRRR